MRLWLALLLGCGRVATAPDAGPSPSDAAMNPEPRAGDTFQQGELIARYDRSLWAALPADEVVYAFFDPARFAAYPDDHSVSFATDAERPFAAGEPASISYRELLRREHIVIDRVPLDGRAFVITASERYHLTENGYGDFAFDLVQTDPTGVRFNGTGADNADYLIWDAAVYLPNGGYVVEVVRDSPDNAPTVTPPEPIENLVGVHLGGSFYLYLLHFRQGSIPAEVVVGAILPRDAYLGRVGNSGLSLEPHLHLSLLWFDGARYWSVPVEFAGIATASGAASPAIGHDFIAPSSGVWIE